MWTAGGITLSLLLTTGMFGKMRDDFGFEISNVVFLSCFGVKLICLESYFSLMLLARSIDSADKMFLLHEDRAP